MLHLVVGLLSLIALAFLLAEFFIVFLLPRRVNRDPAIARGVLRILWIPWRAIAGLLPREAADTMLGVFGPFGLLAILLPLSSGAILAFARHLALDLPDWLAEGDVREEWRAAAGRRRS